MTRLTLLFIIIAIFSCDNKKDFLIADYKKDYYSELNEFSHYGELEKFDSVICTNAIDSAIKTIHSDKFSLYALDISVDSSETPIHILQDRFKLQILAFSESDLLFRYCFNKTILKEYKDKYGYDPIQRTKEIYDSLDNLGLTHIPPSYGTGLKDFSNYFYCNMEYPFGTKIDKPYPTVEVSFEISPTGQVLNPKIEKGFNPEYDSSAIKAVRGMSKWNPTRNEKGEYETYYLNLRLRFDPEMTLKYCR